MSRVLPAPFAVFLEFYFSFHTFSVFPGPIVDALAFFARKFK